MSTRFDPESDQPYGACKTCGLEIPTEDASRTHLDETRENGRGRSHTIQITNPARPTRIMGFVDYEVEAAIREGLDEIQRLVDQGDATAEEVTEALSWHTKFQDIWKQDYIDG